MKWIKTYENFNSINEEFLGFNLSGKFKEGVDKATEFMKGDSDEAKKVKSALSGVDKSDLKSIIDGIKSLFKKGGIKEEGSLTESFSDKLDKITDIIGKVIGVGAKVLVPLGGIISILYGLCSGENILAIIGFILMGIYAASISAFGEN